MQVIKSMNIVSYVLNKTNTLVFVVLFLIATAHVAFGCDSTMLEILTGSKPEASITARLLVVSSKMQVTASYAQAFNHAAADKMHHEAMESWLHVASQITSDPPDKVAADSDFHAVIVQISRDMGSIRQQILQRQLDNVHNQLEICVSRMSLLAAMINGHPRMQDFLRFELLVLGLRPHLQFFDTLKAAILSADFGSVIRDLGLPESPQINERVVALKNCYLTLSDRASADLHNFSPSTQTAYLALYSEFYELKKLLLAEKYFILE